MSNEDDSLLVLVRFHEDKQRTSDNPLSYAWKQTEMRSIGGAGALNGGHSGAEFGRKHCELTSLAECARRAPLPYGGQNGALAGYPGLAGDCMRY